MGKYTKLGSPELDARIDADLARIAELAAPHSLAGILLGGYGRGEGTPFINEDGSQSPFNDYDLIVIVDKPARVVRKQFRTLEQQLSQEFGLPVDLHPYWQLALPTCEFSLLNYEMKHGHRILWGSQTILDPMPNYPFNAIPPSEGARLLLNRGKLLLDIKHRLRHSYPLEESERIHFIKCIFKVMLALGDCALLAENRYDISYDVKRERIEDIGTVPGRDYIIKGYLHACDLKEWGDYSPLKDYNLKKEFKAARNAFCEFFQWYLTRCNGREGSMLKSALLNLIWYKQLLFTHPRYQLYRALPELLGNYPDEHFLKRTLFCKAHFEKSFYKLQGRFS